MADTEYVVYTARINVNRVYEIEIAVPKGEGSEDEAIQAAHNADTMFLHKHGRLEDASVDYAEVEESDWGAQLAEIRVEPGADPRIGAFHVEHNGTLKQLVFGKSAPPYDGIPWEDKI